MNKVNFDNYNNNGEDFERFKSDLLESLSDLVFSTTYVNFCFHLLKCIDFNFVHKPGVHEDDVLLGCEQVKTMFTAKFEVWETAMPSVKEPDLFQLFVYNLLEFETLPGFTLASLERQVKEDLAKRNEMIQYYSEQQYIKNFLVEAATSRDQDEKTLHAFYVRNLEEQQKILNHLLHGLKSRAIIRARGNTDFVPSIYNEFYDRPYLTGFPNTEKY